MVGDLKKRWSWRMAEGFSKKNSVRDPDPVDMSLTLQNAEMGQRCQERTENIEISGIPSQREWV